MRAQKADSHNFKFKSYTTLQGLSDNTIVKTIKDKNGFLWIATHNGICRFDGLNFKSYTYNPYDSTSLRSIWACDLLLDENKAIWASTEFGLCYFDEQTDHFKYINNRSQMQLVFKMPVCLDTKNTIWIACEDGLKKIDAASKKITPTALKRIADPQFVIPFLNDHLIIGTRGKGMYEYDKKLNIYKLIQLPFLPADTHFMDALADADGLWIACAEGLLHLDDKMNGILYNKGSMLADEKVDQLMCVKKFSAAFENSKLICGTYNKRLLLFNKQTKVFEYEWLSDFTNPDGYEPSIIYSIYEDKKMLWLGTDRGLYQLNLENQQQQSYFISALLTGNNKALVKKVITDRADAENLVWLIPWQPYYGIALYDLAQKKIINQWNTSSSKNKKKYTDIFRSAHENYIIASTDSAIDFYNSAKGYLKTLKINASILSVEEDENGNLWLGLANGICFVNKNTNTINYYKPPVTGTDVERNSFGGDFPVTAIKKGDGNILWLANSKYGLFSFDITTKKYTAHRQTYTGLFSTLNRCSDIVVKNSDSIWVGTMAGISCFVPSQNKFINYDAGNGLKSTYVYALGKDEQNNIWARGNADIFCFNTNSKQIMGSKLNQQYDISCYQQKIFIEKNNVLLGHEAGFTVFNAVDFTKSIHDLPVAIISNCKINNAEVYIKKDSNNNFNLKLKYFQNQISFDLNAIEYNFPEEVEYNYKLEGMEKNWTNAGNKRSVSYNHLAPGKYRFAFYVTNEHNKTKSKTAYCNFEISPALWQYWWFWPLLAVIFSGTVVFIARLRIKKIRQKEKQRTATNKAMAELETKMLRSQMNPHFIFNSLNSIQKYIWESKEEDAAEYLANFAKLIRAILENSRKENVTLKEEIDVMKLYVALEHRRSNGGFDYTIKAASNLLEKNILIPPLIMQPFIENAIWHGLNKKDEKGNLLIKVFEENEKLICVIDDDGVGRLQQKKSISKEKKSLGIDITQQRIEKLMDSTGQYANIDIKDKYQNDVATGTTVTITLPLQKY